MNVPNNFFPHSSVFFRHFFFLILNKEWKKVAYLKVSGLESANAWIYQNYIHLEDIFNLTRLIEKKTKK